VLTGAGIGALAGTIPDYYDDCEECHDSLYVSTVVAPQSGCWSISFEAAHPPHPGCRIAMDFRCTSWRAGALSGSAAESRGGESC
jgi:hypothetical protein